MDEHLIDEHLIDGRVFLEALKYVLLAAPKEGYDSKNSRVIFMGRRIIAGDGRRWHTAFLEHDANIHPMACTRLSVLKLRKVLGGILDAADKEAEVTVRVNGRVTTINSEDQPVTKLLETHGDGVWPRDWTVTLPTANKEGLVDPRYLAKHLQEASSWKDSNTTHEHALGHLVVKSYVGDTRVVAVAHLMPLGGAVTVPLDPKQLPLRAVPNLPKGLS
jgi:hypothetical protein